MKELPLADLASRIASQLERPRAAVRGHGGDVVADIGDAGQVEIRFEGACNGCPYVAMTFYAAIKPVLDEIPGVSNVSAPQVHVSPRTQQRIVQMLVDRPPRSPMQA